MHVCVCTDIGEFLRRVWAARTQDNESRRVGQPLRSCRRAFVRAQKVSKHVIHTLGQLRRRSEPFALAHARAAAYVAAVPTCVCFRPPGRGPQASNAHEVPVLEPISHAVLQQGPSAQQTAASLFRDHGATPRHAQVPSKAGSASRRVRNAMALVLEQQEGASCPHFKPKLAT